MIYMPLLFKNFSLWKFVCVYTHKCTQAHIAVCTATCKAERGHQIIECWRYCQLWSLHPAWVIRSSTREACALHCWTINPALHSLFLVSLLMEFYDANRRKRINDQIISKLMVMAKQLITLAASPKDLSSVPTIIPGGSQLPVAPAPRDLSLCCDLCGTERTEPHT